MINNRIPLKRRIQIVSGNIAAKVDYKNDSNLTLQILLDNNRRSYEFQILDESVYQSNFNQMFVLGNYDKNLFEETYNLFPFSRMFRYKFMMSQTMQKSMTPKNIVTN